MARSFLGIVIGVLAGMIVVFGVELAGHLILRTPGIPDTSDAKAVAAAMENLPYMAKFSVIIAWTLGAFVAAALAITIGRGSARGGWIAVAVLWLSGIVTLFTFPHPAWMVICGVLCPLAAGWVAQKIFAST